ncbi:MAG: zinc-binding dehydrogenase, partial [Terriglobales bacterium]
GCAELLKVPESNCWNINALVARFGSKARTLEAGAVIEPFTVGYNALFECAARIKPGAFATVFGAGSIGLAVIQLLRATGAVQVLCFEKNPGRRALATKVGAHAVHDGADAAKIVMEATGGQGADVQVECAGAFNASLPQMEACAANGSQIVIIGRDSKRVPVFLEPFQCKKASIVGAMGNTGYGTYPNVLRMMAAGLLDPTLFITDRFPLDDFNAAVAQARTRQGGKVLVKL